MVAPGCNLPLGFWPSGGLSAKCIEPSRLVCPTVATALAGTTTSGLTEISTSACHWSTFIVPTLPTTTSLIITGEFDSIVETFGISTWYLTASGPRPTAPGSGKEFRPSKAHPDAVNARHDPAMITFFTRLPRALLLMCAAQIMMAASLRLAAGVHWATPAERRAQASPGAACCPHSTEVRATQWGGPESVRRGTTPATEWRGPLPPGGRTPAGPGGGPPPAGGGGA